MRIAKENKKVIPALENKAEVTPLIPANTVEVIISHDGLPIGLRFIADPKNIEKMVSLGFWKRV